MAITQVITTLPDAPDPATDTRDQFSTKAAASVLAQKAMVPELNAWAEQVNTIAAAAVGDVATAIGAASADTPVGTDEVAWRKTATGILKKTTFTNLLAWFAAVAGNAAQAFSAASLELGHASDTTLTRVSAGVVAIEGANILTTTSSQHIQSTRDMTAASGNVAYTGVGFTPKCLVVYGFIDGNALLSIGMSTGTTENCVARDGGASASQNKIPVIVYADPTGTAAGYQLATVSSVDADGFTLAWVKFGAPTGTLTLNVMAFK